MISQVNAVYVVSIASVLGRGREVKGGWLVRAGLGTITMSLLEAGCLATPV